MKRIIALLLLCSGAFAYAHQGEEQAASAGAFDCEHPPADAVTALPEPLLDVGRFTCLPGGQAIAAAKPWTWRYTGSYFDMPLVPASAHRDSAGLAPPFYFHHLSVHDLAPDEAGRQNEVLKQTIVTYRPESDLVGMTRIEAENNYGQVVTMYMPMQTEDKGWLIVCTPECRPDYVIILNKLQKN